MYESPTTPFIPAYSYLPYVHIFCHFTWFFFSPFYFWTSFTAHLLTIQHNWFSPWHVLNTWFYVRIWTMGHISLPNKPNLWQKILIFKFSSTRRAIYLLLPLNSFHILGKSVLDKMKPFPIHFLWTLLHQLSLVSPLVTQGLFFGEFGPSESEHKIKTKCIFNSNSSFISLFLPIIFSK